MRRSYITSAFAGALLLLSGHHGGSGRDRRVQQHVHGGPHYRQGDKDGDCSVNATIEGNTYCFGSEQAKADFMNDTHGQHGKGASPL